jgi:hypothetical protein
VDRSQAMDIYAFEDVVIVILTRRQQEATRR